MVSYFALSEPTAGLPAITSTNRESEPGKASIRVISYNQDSFFEAKIQSVEELAEFRDKPAVVWIHLSVNDDRAALQKLADLFSIDHLVLNDVLNESRRPKVADYGDYLFLIAKALREQDNETVIEQISLIIGKNHVISLQRGMEDIFLPVRERVCDTKGKMRSAGPDYLSYVIVDAIVDNYFDVLETLGEKIATLENEALVNPVPHTIKKVHSLKKKLLYIRKAIWPLREIISRLERGESGLIQPSTQIYLRDLYDHTIQAIDTIETYRDMMSGLLDIYLSSINNRMNEIMKVLTIISTIFIPLSFLASLEGMNLSRMPERDWPWSYPALLILMGGIVIFMLFFFRRKRWI